MRSRWLSMLTAAALLGAPACGGDDEGAKKSAGEAEVTGPQTFEVDVDGDSPNFNAVFYAYFPERLAARPGDTVKFALPHFTGEPHTVTFGSLVDTAVDKLRQMGASLTYSERENLPEMLKLTDVFPHKVGKTYEANQGAAQPCYLDSGDPPFPLEGSGPACPKREQPELNGRQTFYNGGVMQADGDSFSVKLAGDTAPGSYSYICLVHRTLMTGELDVVEAKDSVDPPEDVAARGEKQLEEFTASLDREVEELAAATVDKAVAGTMPLSVSEKRWDPDNADVAEFGPKELSVPVGATVTWAVRMFHSIAINAPEEAIGLLARQPDGAFRFNPAGVFATGSPDPPVDYINFPPTTDKPITVDGKAFTGAFKNSGLFGSVPPPLMSYKVTFPKAGTYTLRCTFHPDMKGQIKVG
jgi:plastocyanin